MEGRKREAKMEDFELLVRKSPRNIRVVWPQALIMLKLHVIAKVQLMPSPLMRSYPVPPKQDS